MKTTLIAVALALIAYTVFEGMYFVWDLVELPMLLLPVFWLLTLVCAGFIFIDPIVGGSKREQHYSGFQTARV